ncbi:hypothetical protein DFH94DRAFT_709610 [Russula ochroleuca]|uniref:COQ9 C-terminal domain-containing protein n=1 Tax=Russula ochroleuca TaxID=152965 RepID=A0A9P5TDE0_9AGAM|nr:hypothetical protein DFH94DRAFT_709610 [Russula ochroleuca]
MSSVHLRTQLLKLATPLVQLHGFTRTALANSVLSLPEPHAEPLSDSAVTVLFGEGDAARRTLINAWLDEGRGHMRAVPVDGVKRALLARLEYNVPVLRHLPEAFGLVASPRLGIPPIDLLPAIQHAAGIADEACRVTNDASVGPSWYTKRATLAAIYAAAELHQLTSPPTAPAFLDSLFESASHVENALSEAEVFAQYVARSWVAIAKSST